MSAADIGLRSLGIEARALELTDLALLVRWGRDPDLSKQLRMGHLFASEEYWLRVMRSAAARKFFMMVTRTGEPIGLSAWYGHDAETRRIFTGTLVGDRALRGKGLGTCIKLWQLGHLFDLHDILEIRSEVSAENRPMLRILQKLGYAEREGRACPESVVVVEKLETLAISRAEWRKARGTSPRHIRQPNCDACPLPQRRG